MIQACKITLLSLSLFLLTVMTGPAAAPVRMGIVTGGTKGTCYQFGLSWCTMRRSIITLLSVALSFLILSGCTAIGPTALKPKGPVVDPGPEVEIRVCLYKDVTLPDEKVVDIIEAVQKEFAPYGLKVTVAAIKPWKRTGFHHREIIKAVGKTPLEAPCDRNLVLVGRDMRDLLWGATLLPEYLGAVETVTHTKGYVVAEAGSLNQLLSLQSPSKVAIHEFYHMLGIGHVEGALVIHRKINALKRSAIKNRKSGCGFFPGISPSGMLYLSRTAVDRRFGISAPPP